MDKTAKETWDKKLLQHRTILKRVLEQRLEFLNTNGLISSPTAVCDDLYSHAINYNGRIASERSDRVKRSWQRSSHWWKINTQSEEFKKDADTFFDQEEKTLIDTISELTKHHNVRLDVGRLSLQQNDLRQSSDVLKARALEEIEDLSVAKQKQRTNWLLAVAFSGLQIFIAFGVAYYSAVKTNEERLGVERLGVRSKQLTKRLREKVEKDKELIRRLQRVREHLSTV